MFSEDPKIVRAREPGEHYLGSLKTTRIQMDFILNDKPFGCLFITCSEKNKQLYQCNLDS